MGIQDSKDVGTKELLTKTNIPIERLISKLREQNNLDVICANIRHPSEEKAIFQICNKYDVLARSLKNKLQNYDFVILDAPASTNSLVINVLYASDYIVLPLQCEKLAVDSLSRFLTYFQSLQTQIKNKELKLAGLLFTMFKENNLVHRRVCEQITDFIILYFKLRLITLNCRSHCRKQKLPLIGLLYQKLAQLYDKQMFATKSIRYYKKAIEKFADLDEHSKSFCLYEEGLVFKNIFQFPQALDCLQSGVKIFLALKNNAYALKSLEQIRKILLSQGNINKAREMESQIVRLGQKNL